MTEQHGPINLEVEVPKGKTIEEAHVKEALLKPEFIKEVTAAMAKSSAHVTLSNKTELPKDPKKK